MELSLKFFLITIVYTSCRALLIPASHSLSYLREAQLALQNQLAKCTNPVKLVVEHSSVLNFAPWLKLHHIVFIGTNDQRDGVYAIDFTPIDQSNMKTIAKLLRGKNVPAEVRVRYFDSANLVEKEQVTKEWSCMNLFIGEDERKSRQATAEALLSASQAKTEEQVRLQKTIERIMSKWNASMNFYTHNCQHFSAFCRNLIQRDDICPVD